MDQRTKRIVLWSYAWLGWAVVCLGAYYGAKWALLEMGEGPLDQRRLFIITAIIFLVGGTWILRKIVPKETPREFFARNKAS